LGVRRILFLFSAFHGVLLISLVVYHPKSMQGAFDSLREVVRLGVLAG